MDTHFMLGDLVQCTDAISPISNYLTAGEVYTVLSTQTVAGFDYVMVSGSEKWFRATRFSAVPDSPEVTAPVDMKFDGGKPRMALLTSGMPQGLLEIGKVLTFGAEKYAADSWKTVANGEERYASALVRHLLAFQSGEKVDPETGLSHLAHLACNALFLLELEVGK